MFLENQRVGLFVDGSNLFYTLKAIASKSGFPIKLEYTKILKVLQSQQLHVAAANFYMAADNDGQDNRAIPFLDFISFNGYRLISKPIKTFVSSSGRTVSKGNMDIEIAVDMVELRDKVDHIILFTGDGDFCYAVAACQRHGVVVTVVSSLTAIATELRKQANYFIQLEEFLKSYKFNHYSADNNV